MQSMSNVNKQDIRVRFGLKVRALRRARKFSQEELGNICQLHRTYISDIEGGGRNVSLINIKKLAQAFKVSMSQLLKGL